MIREGNVKELSFSAEVPPEHFRFISAINKVKFEDFTQNVDG